MTKLFKNHILSAFIAIAFSFSQIINVHANHLEKNSLREEVSITEQGRQNAINTAAFYISSFNHGVKNETAVEGKIEKVFEPVTIGTFGIGIALGYGSTAIGLLFGWIITKIVMLFK